MVALRVFSSATADAAKAQLDKSFKEKVNVLHAAVRTTGSSTSTASIAALDMDMAAINKMNREAPLRNTMGQRVADFFSAYTTDFGSSYDEARQRKTKTRQEDVRVRAAQLMDPILAARDELVTEVSSYDEFLKHKGGIGSRLMSFAAQLPGGANIEAATRKMLENKAREIEAKKAPPMQAGELGAAGYEGTQTGRLYFERAKANESRLRLPTDLERFSPEYATGLSLGGSKFSATVAQLPLSENTKNMANEVNKAFEELPKILLKGTFTDKFPTEVRESLKGVGIGKEVATAIEEELTGMKLEKFRDGLNEVEGFTRHLLKGFDAVVEGGARLASAMDELAKKEMEGLKLAFDTRQSAIAQATAVQQSQLEIERTRYSFSSQGKPLPGKYGDQIAWATARAYGGSDDVDTLARKLAGVTDKIQNGQGNAGLVLEAQSLTLALKALSDTTMRLKGVQEELTFVEQNRKAKLSIAEGWFGADAGERIQQLLEMRAAKFATESGFLLGMPIVQQNWAVSALKKLGAVENIFNSGMNGQQVLDRLVQQVNPKMFAGDNANVKTLQERVLTVMIDSKNAQIALQNNTQQMFTFLVQSLNQSFQNFLGALAPLVAPGKEVPKLPAPAPMPALAPIVAPVAPGAAQAPVAPGNALGGAPVFNPLQPREEAPKDRESVLAERRETYTDQMRGRRAGYLAGLLKRGAGMTDDRVRNMLPEIFPRLTVWDFKDSEQMQTLLRLKARGTSREQMNEAWKFMRDQNKAQEKTPEAPAAAPAVNEEAINQLKNAMGQFAVNVDRFERACGIVPNTIQLDGNQNVNVNMNGAEVLTRLEPVLEQLVTDKTQLAFDRLVRRDPTKPPTMDRGIA